MSYGIIFEFTLASRVATGFWFIFVAVAFVRAFCTAVLCCSVLCVFVNMNMSAQISDQTSESFQQLSLCCCHCCCSM